MQAITIAIGKAGIDFFVQQLLAKELVNLLSGLKAPDKTIDNIPNISIGGEGPSYWYNIVINLTQGELLGFNPTYQSISQQKGGIFNCVIEAGSFSAQYNWSETYDRWYCTLNWGTEQWECEPGGSFGNQFQYAPTFSGMTTNIPLQFEYDNQNQKWSFVAGTSNGNAVINEPNIPPDSIIQEQEGCLSTHVSDATAQAISNLDLNTSINQLIAGTIASIPDSGNLGDGMVYDFSLGDSGILFPNDDGIQMAVKGGASYNGKDFTSVNPPPSLPFPIPPADTDTHHLNMYVSNYEIDALNWAFYEAGKLNLTVTPQELPDPQLLHVSKYTSLAKQLDPYAPWVMNAGIVQNSAPVTSFQTVYIYNPPVMSLLQTQLPSSVYQLILGLGGNAYLSLSDVETFLNEVTVPDQYFSEIEDAAKTSAMVLTQDINFTLTIETPNPPQPVINFSVSRQDVLTGLKLGVSSNNAQTLQFGFTNADNSATFENSSIPGLDGTIFESLWQLGLENSYITALQALGTTGTPLPIMDDFKFDFENAGLSIQEGYISILANVLYKNS